MSDQAGRSIGYGLAELPFLIFSHVGSHFASAITGVEKATHILSFVGLPGGSFLMPTS
jgi:hypothetical protein